MQAYIRVLGLVAAMNAIGVTAALAQDAPQVTEASYGHNCPDGKTKPGNVTKIVVGICSKQKGSSCTIKVDYKEFGSPPGRCVRDFRVRYQCQKGGDTQSIGGEADGQSITIRCPIK